MPLALHTAICPAALVPEIILVAVACLILVFAQFRSARTQRILPAIALTGIVAGIGATVVGTIGADDVIAGGGLRWDRLAFFVRNSMFLAGFLIALVSWLESQPGQRAEFWSLLLFSLGGLSLVGAADDLVILFLALELVSVPAYAIVALSQPRPQTQEAAIKYFFLGAMAAAITAYGFSLLYGVAGSAALPTVTGRLPEALSAPAGTFCRNLAAAGLILSLAGLMFKIAAVPLHFYIADVYCGASSPVAGFLGFIPKIAGTVAILKLAAASGWGLHGPSEIFYMLWLVAAASMTIGNVLALRQTNVKRMLAYSGVAHSGYMLVGLILGLPDENTGLLGDGVAAVLYYVVIYGLANLGAFGVLGLLRVQERPAETLRDLAGLLRRHPLLALLLALCLVTLMGLPPTAGFWGKLALFGSALASPAQGAAGPYHSWLVALVVLALVNSAVAAAYYLRAIAAILLYENDYPAEAIPHESPHLGVALCGFLLLALAAYPGLLWEPGQRASSALSDARAGVTLRETPQPAGHRPAQVLRAEAGAACEVRRLTDSGYGRRSM
jgi:NADH-quinone oxidoreductase subunit N